MRACHWQKLIPLSALALVLIGLAGVGTASASTLFAWGRNLGGQFGDGRLGEHARVPVEVGVGEVTAISAQRNDSLMLLSNGTVEEAGFYDTSPAGDGEVSEHQVPVLVEGLSNVLEISEDNEHGLARLSDGTVEAWGYNQNGTLGDGHAPYDSRTGVSVWGLSGAVAVSGGFEDSVAALSNGTVAVWGQNGYGQLGDGATTGPEACDYGTPCSQIPVLVPNLSNVKTVAGGENYTLALLTNGTVMAWGYNGEGQLGDGKFGGGSCECSDVPVPVQGLSNVVAIAAGGGEGDSLALLKNGTVMAWGIGRYGQLGNGTFTYASDVPVIVEGLTKVKAIASGGSDDLALLKNGKLMSWGSNLDGALGAGSETESSDVPVAVEGMSKVEAIAAGEFWGLALTKLRPIPPTVTGISPPTGPLGGGTAVTVTGAAFVVGTTATTFKFGKTPGTSVNCTSTTTCTVVAPSATTAGSVDVRATVSKKTSKKNPGDEYNYE